MAGPGIKIGLGAIGTIERIAINAIHNITEKNSLNDGDIQAIKELLSLIEFSHKKFCH